MRSFCLFILLSLVIPAAFAFQSGIDRHNIGDVIAVKTDDEIAKWCNFDKQIVVTQTNVLCVYNGKSKRDDFFSR